MGKYRDVYYSKSTNSLVFLDRSSIFTEKSIGTKLGAFKDPKLGVISKIYQRAKYGSYDYVIRRDLLRLIPEQYPEIFI